MPTDERPHQGRDYEADELLVVSEYQQLRALADDSRTAIIALLSDRARSTQQLAGELGMPKGTVGHHIKVLEAAGLIRVVRTRQVRGITEKFYGRTARLFRFHIEDPASQRELGASVFRQVARELEGAAEEITFGYPKARLAEGDVRRFERRLKRLFDDFQAAEHPAGTPYALATVLYRRPDA